MVFIPARLLPKPPIQMDAALNRLLYNAVCRQSLRSNRALGKLEGATSILPNPDLLVAM